MPEQNFLSSVNIPPRFANETFETFKATTQPAKHNLTVCQQYVNTWEDRKNAGEGLIFCGIPGTGKTHLAVSIAREIAEDLQESVFITTAARIIRAFRRTWSGNSEFSELDVLAKYCDPDLLIIDEIGVQYGTDSERNILFEVINDRYEYLLPTILVSNLPLNELEEMLGERVVDRLLQGGTVLTFNWPTYRRGNHS
ncbi:ATP-binding protein [Providencia stuartii]|uniref:ATP-binding protein n=1 Tax=Providencia TaxID=586 RepID=UPI0013A75105|nr:MULTISPECIES: ATP-binding protein [Providencia]QIB29848.1 ATP-binding protein [Providencia stuartii]QPN42155.1 ATP-binding protein [Providencia sp. 2.29]WAZ77136.1 ATP-binding protein [Providencia stuartii]WAZ81715.1 ATP-binding protein [Providencia stuartii]